MLGKFFKRKEKAWARPFSAENQWKISEKVISQPIYYIPVAPTSFGKKFSKKLYKVVFSIFIRISHSTWEEKQHLAKQHLLLRKRLLAAFRDTYVKKWKTLVKTSSLFSRVKIRRIFTLKRDFYCDARLENIQKVSKRAKIWQFMTFLENVW